jgi:hypothetical protein
MTGVQFPAEEKNFSSSLFVQTSYEAHPTSCPMVNGGPFPGAKARPGRDADHSSHLMPRSWMSRSYTSSPQTPPYRVVRQFYFTLQVITVFFNLRSYFTANLRVNWCFREMDPFLACISASRLRMVVRRKKTKWKKKKQVGLTESQDILCSCYEVSGWILKSGTGLTFPSRTLRVERFLCFVW